MKADTAAPKAPIYPDFTIGAVLRHKTMPTRQGRGNRTMKLLTKENRRVLPPLHSTEKQPDDQKLCHVKFFTPWSSWTWYALEASARTTKGRYVALEHVSEFHDQYFIRPGAPIADLEGAYLDDDESLEDIIFFGYVDGLEPELGYFALSELAGVAGPFGLKIERDRYWAATPLSEIR